MNLTQSKLTAGLMTLAGVALAAEPQEPTLKVGDPAPKLQVAKWVQGEPVKELEKGKVYLVEFWATWCGPCRVSIPHLNKVHEKFKGKGLIVIGQDCWERDEDLVEPFVKKMGDRMTYRVALDDKEGNERGQMAETWMTAAGQNGIPSAFLVDKQTHIAWIGHPMELSEAVIQQVIDDKYDLKKAAAEHAKRLKNEEELRTLSRELNSNLGKKDWSAAEKVVAEIEKLLPKEQHAFLGMTRFQILVGQRDYKGAYALASRLSDAQPDNANLQNSLAWGIATDKGIEERDLNLAEKFARRASSASEGKDPAILDTLARVLFMKGQKEKAIEVQQKAVNEAEGDYKKQMQEVLDNYKEGKLPDVE